MERTGGEEEVIRVRTPRGKETVGTVIEVLGGSRFRVSCSDGRERLCRVPGRSKRKMFVKNGDVILIEPWSIEGDEKGDIIWRYKPAQASWLASKGILKQ